MPETKDGLNDAWLGRLFAAVDSRNAADFGEFLHERCRFVYGSREPVEGKQAICDYLAGFFDSLAGISHTIFEAWVVADKVFVEIEVTYELKDGRRFTMPAFDFFKMEGELIKDFLIYVDPSPMLDGAEPGA